MANSRAIKPILARGGSQTERGREAPPRFPGARSTFNGMGRLAESLVLAAEPAKTPGEGIGAGPDDELFTGLIHVAARGAERQRNDKSDRPTPVFHRFQTALMMRFMTILPIVPI